MVKGSDLARESAWLLAARLFTHLAAALLTLAAARRLGAGSFGEYAFIAAWVAIGNLLTTFGTDMLLIRETAAGAARRLFPAALVLQLALSALFVAGVVGLSRFAGFLSPTGAMALRLYSLALFPLAFFTIFTTALRGHRQMGAYAALTAALGFFQLAAALTFFLRGGRLLDLATALLGVQIAAALLAAWLCSRAVPTFWDGWRVSLSDLQALLAACAPFAWLSVLAALYQRLGPALLPALAGALPAGQYSAAARLVELVKVGQAASFTVLYPAMAQRPEIGEKISFRLPALVLLGASTLAALALSALSGPLVAWLYGVDYLAAAAILRVLSWGLLPFTLNTYLSLALMARGGERRLAFPLAASLLALAALTAWWGQASGALGAAWAALVAECLQSALLLLQARRPRQAVSLTIQEA